MKKRILIKNALIRLVTVLLFAVACAGAVSYSLGKFEIPFVRREDNQIYRPDLTSFESTVRDLPTGALISGDPATGTGSSSTGSLSGDETTETGNSPAAFEARPMAEMLDSGWSLSWADWNEGMCLALVPLSADSYRAGSQKYVITQKKLDYGLWFETKVQRQEARKTVELYMGYVLVDEGVADGDDPVPLTRPSQEDPTVTEREGRKTYYGVPCVSIYNSYGTLIGTYSSDLIIPAYTRDKSDRPLFLLKSKYYYLSEETGDFVLSDYDDEADNRGLYFDYRPDYGRSDNGLLKWSTVTPRTIEATIITDLYYSHFAVDWRLCKPIQAADPDYAYWTAYSNKPFAAFLEAAKKELAAESRAALTATTAPETTQAPEETSLPPETTAEDTLTGTLPLPPEQTSEAMTKPDETTVTEPQAQPSATDIPSAAEPAPVTPDVTTEPLSPETDPQTDPVTQKEDPPATPEQSETAAPPESSAPDTASPETGTASPEPGTGEPETLPPESVTQETEPATSPEETSAEQTEPVVTEPETTEEGYHYLNVSTVSDVYRFAYGYTRPAEDPNLIRSTDSSVNIYYVQRISWGSGYRYAKAFNYSEGLAVTFDDLGMMRIIDTNGYTTMYRNETDTSTENAVGYSMKRYYAEPFYKDRGSLGHYYFDHGYLRVRELSLPEYNQNYYAGDRDLLIDPFGRTYDWPAGFEIYSYSDGIIVLKNNGLYGCWSVEKEKWIADPMFTYAEPFIEGLCVLGLSDGTVCVIDTEGRIVIPFTEKYTEITSPSSGLIACWRDTDGWSVYAKMAK